MRGSSWPVLADLEPIWVMFRRSGRPILGTLGASVGQVWGLVGWLLEAGKEKMVMLWKIKKMWKKHRKNARNFAKYWTFCVSGESKIWGWGPKWATWIYPRSKVGSK